MVCVPEVGEAFRALSASAGCVPIPVGRKDPRSDRKTTVGRSGPTLGLAGFGIRLALPSASLLDGMIRPWLVPG
jgi:hypothetical protein